jgi:hypothetical protein
MTSEQKELLAWFFKRQGSELNRCLAPGMNCARTAIQAHSVQNSRIRDLLAHNGHVKRMSLNFSRDKRPEIRLDDVGRNQATTFTGFCSQHDSEIFAPIETRPFRPTDQQQLFLFAYRAVARELHVLMEAAIKIQAAYTKRVELGIDKGDQPEPAGMLAIDHMVRAYTTYLYKQHFDEALISQEHERILHQVFSVHHKQPTIAVCSLYSVDNMLRGDDWVRVALNVFPISETESAVIFSYVPEDEALALTSLSSILTSDGAYQQYLLSKVILNNCENFVISPTYYDRWSPEKKAHIVEYFTNTLFTGNLDMENKDLYLF